MVHIDVLFKVLGVMGLEESLKNFEGGLFLKICGVLGHQKVELVDGKFAIKVTILHNVFVKRFDGFVSDESAKADADVIKLRVNATVLVEELLVNLSLSHAKEGFHIFLDAKIPITIFPLKYLFFKCLKFFLFPFKSIYFKT